MKLVLQFYCLRVPAIILLVFAQSIDADEPATTEVASLPRVAQEIVERTKREFRKARFYKPLEGDSSDLEQKLAPLIVEEFDHDSKILKPFGNSLDEPTVYFNTGSVLVEGQKLNQIVFVWWYRAGDSRVVRRPFTYQGVRIVLGSDGMPCLWEALSPLFPSPRVFFVSQSLETAAMKQFGPPLPGRAFSIERSLEQTEGVVVAAALDDGPVPMGPYVYVDVGVSPRPDIISPQRTISTIHCRCSSSQFEEAVETLEYRLEPFEQMAAAFFAGQAFRRIDIETVPLDELFRWPTK